MLGERLRSARMSRGLSLRDLQAKIGNKVSAQAIGKYENGDMSPSPEKITMLANALDVSVNFLTDVSPIKLRAVNFRENFLRSKKEEAQVKATIVRYLENYLEIEELLRVDTIDWSPPDGSPFLVNDPRDFEWAAFSLRNHWKLGDDPISNFPELLENKGIKVVFYPLPDSVDGVTCFVEYKNANKIPVILVNKNTTAERQRFSLAHELGHLVLEKVSPPKKDESNCNRFAGAFLMPENILWDNLGKHRHSISIGEMVSLKKILGVSIMAIPPRCSQLGIIGQSLYRKIWSDFVKRGYTKPPYNEPEKLDQAEQTQRLKRLCFRAITEKSISLEKASFILEVPQGDIHNEMTLNS